MAHARKLSAFIVAAMATILSIGMEGQTGDPATLIQEKLIAQIKLTKTAADRSDIVTAGDVVLLHKDGLMMCGSSSPYAFSNTYSNGVLTANLGNRAKNAAKSFALGRLPFGGGGSVADAANNGCPSRKFVAGEKFWITGIAISGKGDGIIVTAYSDPYNDQRYYGEIKFPFVKGSVPPADDFVKTVSELITVQPPDDKGGDQASQPAPAAAASAAPAPAAAPAPMPDIAPPPPPADAPPPTISIGQTKDQVVAAFGQPQRTAKVGVKEIFYYPDKMKVTFTNGKVSNIE